MIDGQKPTHTDYEQAFALVLEAARVRLLHWQSVRDTGGVPDDLIDELYEAAAEDDLYEATNMTELLEEAIGLVGRLEVKEPDLSWLRVEGEI